MKEMVFAGSGGQGVLTTGMVCATAGMDLGKNVTWYPSYGSQMRGGTANCSVKFDDKAIASPFLKNVDILCAMNTPSVDSFQGELKPGAVMFVDSGVVPEDYPVRDDIKVVRVPVNEIAHKAGNPRGANLVMLGAMAAHTDIFTVDEIVKAVEKFFKKKGIDNPKNLECLKLGAEC